MSLLMDQSRSVLPLRSAKAREFGELWRETYARTLDLSIYFKSWPEPVLQFSTVQTGQMACSNLIIIFIVYSAYMKNMWCSVAVPQERCVKRKTLHNQLRKLLSSLSARKRNSRIRPVNRKLNYVYLDITGADNEIYNSSIEKDRIYYLKYR